MCCHQHTFCMGNIFEKSFDEVWFSEAAKEVREKNAAGLIPAACNTPMCPFVYRAGKSNFEPIIDKSKFVSRWRNKNGYPIDLEMDLHSSHCNFGGTALDRSKMCYVCPRRHENVYKAIILFPDRTEEIIEKVKHLMPHLQSLSFLGLAEPFWQGKVFQCLERIGFPEHRHHIYFWTFSNGSLFSEETMKKFAETVNKSAIYFSLDAATKETYLKLRRHDLFSVVVKNVRRWVNYSQRIEKTEKCHHIIGIYNNINFWNVHEVPDMVKMAHDLGVGKLTLCTTHDMAGVNAEVTAILPNQENAKIFVKAMDEAQSLAKSLRVNLDIFRPLDLHISHKLKML